MNQIRKSLFTKIFTAIAAPAVLGVIVMALLMREGFAQYLLKGELARFDEFAVSLADAYQGGRPELVDDPLRWDGFVRAHVTPPPLPLILSHNSDLQKPRIFNAECANAPAQADRQT